MTIDEIKRQIFIDSEEVCGNTMIDTYQAQEYVEQAHNKAIDDFAETLIPRLTDAIYPKDVEGMRNLINDVAEQLKADGEYAGSI